MLLFNGCSNFSCPCRHSFCFWILPTLPPPPPPPYSTPPAKWIPVLGYPGRAYLYANSILAKWIWAQASRQSLHICKPHPQKCLLPTTPELTSDDFLKQFSWTLSNAEHFSTRCNTAAPAGRRPWLCTNCVCLARGKCSAPLVAPQLSVPAPLHPARDRQGVNTPAEALQQPHSAASTAKT